MICLVANQVYVGVHDNYYLMAFPDNGAARQLVEEYCTLYVYVKLLVECRVDTCRIQMTVRLMKKLPLNSNDHDMLITTTNSSYIYACPASSVVMLTPSLLTIPALEVGNSKRSQLYCSKQHGK